MTWGQQKPRQTHSNSHRNQPTISTQPDLITPFLHNTLATHAFRCRFKSELFMLTFSGLSSGDRSMKRTGPSDHSGCILSTLKKPRQAAAHSDPTDIKSCLSARPVLLSVQSRHGGAAKTTDVVRTFAFDFDVVVWGGCLVAIVQTFKNPCLALVCFRTQTCRHPGNSATNRGRLRLACVPIASRPIS